MNVWMVIIFCLLAFRGSSISLIDRSRAPITRGKGIVTKSHFLSFHLYQLLSSFLLTLPRTTFPLSQNFSRRKLHLNSHMQVYLVPNHLNNGYDALRRRNPVRECIQDAAHTQERGFVNEHISAYLSQPVMNEQKFPSQSGARRHTRDVWNSWRNDNGRVGGPQLGHPGVQPFLPGSNKSAQVSAVRNLPQASQVHPVSHRGIKHQTSHNFMYNRRTFDTTSIRTHLHLFAS